MWQIETKSTILNSETEEPEVTTNKKWLCLSMQNSTGKGVYSVRGISRTKFLAVFSLKKNFEKNSNQIFCKMLSKFIKNSTQTYRLVKNNYFHREKVKNKMFQFFSLREVS